MPMKLEIGVSPSGAPNSLAGRIASLRETIAGAARTAGRDPAGIKLLAVTKRQPREAVVEALSAGVTEIGENYVQEAAEKYASLPVATQPLKHFIGHVQTNKAKAIVETFDVVQSIDRFEAGEAIAKFARALGKPVRVLVQVNVSDYDRFGVTPEAAEALAGRLRDEAGLDVDGVMAIAPLGSDRDGRRRAFERAAAVRDRVGGSTLSLGMSDDLTEAIACGSTMVRVGTAIFGARE